MGYNFVVIPGYPGSVLRRGAPTDAYPEIATWPVADNQVDVDKDPRIIWPPNTAGMIGGHPNPDLLASNDVTPICPMYEFNAKLPGLGRLPIGILSPLMNELAAIVGGPNASDLRVRGFGYDWRRDLREAAGKLAQLIDREFGWNNDPVVLVAHSTGGLVARYMLESGDHNGTARKRVSHLIALAVPHLGTPISLEAALGIDIIPTLKGNDIKRLTQDARFPGLYQLFPFKGTGPYVYQRLPDGSDAPLDIYKRSDAENRLGLFWNNVVTAMEFQKKLGLAKKPKWTSYSSFWSEGSPTTSDIIITSPKGAARTFETRTDMVGDGTVRVESARLSQDKFFDMTRTEHVNMPGTVAMEQLIRAALKRPA